MSVPEAPERSEGRTDRPAKPEPESSEPDNVPPKRAAWFRYTDASSIGIEIAVAVTLGAVGGMWLERNVTHWSPWTTLIGIALGLAAAGRAVLRTARRYRREIAASNAASAETHNDADPKPDPDHG